MYWKSNVLSRRFVAATGPLFGLALASCGTVERVQSIGRGPTFTAAPPPVAPPWQSSLAEPAASGRTAERPAVIQVPRGTSAAPLLVPGVNGSLFHPAQGSLFRDQRAFREGDILTVRVDISDSAQLRQGTQRQRDGSESGGVSNLFGLEGALRQLLGGRDPAKLVQAQTASGNSGQGQVARSEAIAMTIAAVVVAVLPNGNFQVRGRQQTRVNQELRDLVIEGIVRPQDIARDNSVRHSQIADARISYGGKGLIQDAQQPRWGQQLIDAISPF
ncbi:flagellar basal body L-ring protein FlgH [Sandaracinobacteroides saxicola]|uniref:Flagellar L-ring protein n=2 Tax=Sandaracinobacteroides saxicola TaxID=2759707 RepID=A0A7G5IK14_9SPHN|nr:flagellar basal body L-ring protein FlgH [Sandaracinobacteroides saxicola]